ncbi:hypothetical protein [Actinoallomurus sp. CA-150999]|uniref:hypothetical protein n=1 Tax=Actinoallomurus sp. CA-150999 TaxID=3239887 RepID=UPI003D94BA47
METALPTSAVISDESLPEPTSYRGQFIIPLDVDQSAWRTYYGLTYWLTPFAESQAGSFAISLISPDGMELTCGVYDESGEPLQTWDNFPDTRNPGARSLGITLRQLQDGGNDNGPWTDLVHGNSLTFRFNYTGSQQVKDVVVPLDFDQPLTEALDKRRLCFRLREQPVTSTSLRGLDEDRPEPRTPLIYLHGYEDPDTGHETPGTRVPPFALTRQRISTAWQTAKTTGYFDPAVFPNVANGTDDAARAGMQQAVAGLDDATVVQQLSSGARLVVSRAPTGEYGYRFLPAPGHCAPGLVLVEYYRLTSLPGRYGAGRVLKTFSLLPGEQTSIRISTYRRSAVSQQQAASILDSTSTDTEDEFSRTVNSEQSNQDNSAKSFEYRAEVEAEGNANWGWGSASAKASAGVSGSSNSAREEFTKNLTNAVAQNSARASSRRDVQIDTSMDMKLEEGEEQAVERTLENINVSRTLNFVFRQMNHEYLTLLHLVDIRVAFFNGHAESRDEVPLADLDRLLGDCLLPEKVAEAREAITRELQKIVDVSGEARQDFVQTVSLTGADGQAVSYLRVTPGYTSTYTADDGSTHTVPGIVVGADSHVLRTDGVVVDSVLGDGDALDAYSAGLQTQAVRAQQVENDRRQAETDKLRLALQLVQSGDSTGVDLYRRAFPIPSVVNQIDHAAVGSPPVAGNGQAGTAPAM